MHRSQFKSSENKVKYSAFIPPQSLKLSVYRISGIQNQEIWNMGNEYVAKPQSKTVLGRADILASEVLNLGEGLSLEPDPKPHPRHANITGWAVDKSKQKLVAIKLADKAKFESIPGQPLT